jgi:pterin-4a-carbinolamine dehydratase
MGELYDDISTARISLDGVTPFELAHELEALGPRWAAEGGALYLVLSGPMSRTGVAVAFIGTLADELGHYPRVLLEREAMTLKIQTPDVSHITVIDLVFAGRLEQWLRANGWSM